MRDRMMILHQIGNWMGKVADSIDHEMKMKCNFGMNPMPKMYYSHLQVRKQKPNLHTHDQTERQTD